MGDHEKCKKRYRCDICNNSFTTKLALRCHENLHTGQRPYQCPFCEDAFRSPNALNYHVKVSHATKSLCTKISYSSQVSFEKPALKSLVDVNDQKPSKNQVPKKLSDPSTRRRKKKKGRGMKSCRICGKVFVSSAGLRFHLKTHQGLFTCNVCGRTFSKSRALIRHRANHSKKAPEVGNSQPRLPGEDSSHFIATSPGDDKAKRTSTRLRTSGKRRRSDFETVCLEKEERTVRLSATTENENSCSPNEDLPDHKRVKLKEKNKPFRCNTCESSFTNLASFVNHKKRHAYNSYLCKYCGKRFFLLRLLRAHEVEDHGRQGFKCKVCLKIYTTISGLDYHMKNAHQVFSASGEPVTASTNNSTSHPQGRPMELPFASKGTESVLMSYQCQTCARTFSTKKGLRLHVMRAHGVPTREVTQNAVISHECQKCARSFSTRKGLAVHLTKRCSRGQNKTRSRAEIGYKCNACERSFPSKKGWLLHTRTYCPSVLGETQGATMTYKCQACGQAFPTEGSLAIHVKGYCFLPQEQTRDGAWIYKCRACAKSFSTKGGLLLHVTVCFSSEITETQTAETKHKCQSCAASFSTERSLALHMRAYCSAKREKMSVGKKIVTDQAHRASEGQRESEDLDYKCQICAKTFSTGKGLACHLKVHQSSGKAEDRSKAVVYKCLICASYFSTYQGLSSHCKAHRFCGLETEELAAGMKYKCPTCAVCLLTAGDLALHFKTCPVDSTRQKYAQNSGEEIENCPVDDARNTNSQSNSRSCPGKEPSFKCTVCGRHYASYQGLSYHLQTHASARPYTCGECGKTFKRASTMKNHEKTHVKYHGFTLRGKRRLGLNTPSADLDYQEGWDNQRPNVSSWLNPALISNNNNLESKDLSDMESGNFLELDEFSVERRCKEILESVEMNSDVECEGEGYNHVGIKISNRSVDADKLSLASSSKLAVTASHHSKPLQGTSQRASEYEEPGESRFYKAEAHLPQNVVVENCESVVVSELGVKSEVAGSKVHGGFKVERAMAYLLADDVPERSEFKVWECFHCKMKLYSRESHHQHQMSHELQGTLPSQMQYMCFKCGSDFDSASSLVEHMSDAHL